MRRLVGFLAGACSVGLGWIIWASFAGADQVLSVIGAPIGLCAVLLYALFGTGATSSRLPVARFVSRVRRRSHYQVQGFPYFWHVMGFEFACVVVFLLAGGISRVFPVVWEGPAAYLLAAVHLARLVAVASLLYLALGCLQLRFAVRDSGVRWWEGRRREWKFWG